MKTIIIIAVVICALFLLLVNLLAKRENEKSKEKAGAKGEQLIYDYFKQFKGDGARVLKNCLIPRKNETTEIDTLFICKQGVLVVETKNYSGEVVGKIGDDKWTQIRAYNGERIHFHNPIKQNEIHIRCLDEYLKMDIPYYSLIVFSDKCDINSVATNSIINMSDLDEYMDSFFAFTPRLTQKQIDAIFNRLNASQYASSSQKRKHIQEIKREHKD